LVKLWVLLFVALILAFSAEYNDHLLYRKKGKYDLFFTCILILLLTFFSGLRVWGNDTVTYLQMYSQTRPLAEYLTASDVSLASGWGFGFLTSLIKDLGFSSQDYLMFYAFLTVTPYVLFVRRYCPDFIFGVFLMFTTGFYTFSMAAIKQCMATGICLLAVMAALDGKWRRYSILMVLAFLFQPYSVIYLIVPFMMFRPWTKWTYIYIVLFTAAGFMLESLLGVILDVTDLIGAEYNTESFTGAGVNLFRVLVSFVPLVLSIPYQKTLFQDVGKTEYLMFNLCTIHAMIMFVGLFGTANYFARLANYLLPAVVVTIPWMLNTLQAQNRLLLKVFGILGYSGYFAYDNLIRTQFDKEYTQITLWQYITSHF